MVISDSYNPKGFSSKNYIWWAGLKLFLPPCPPNWIMPDSHPHPNQIFVVVIPIRINFAPPIELFFAPFNWIIFCTTPNWIIFFQPPPPSKLLWWNSMAPPPQCLRHCVSYGWTPMKSFYFQWNLVSDFSNTKVCFTINVVIYVVMMCIVELSAFRPNLVARWHARWKHDGFHEITNEEWNLIWYCFIFIQYRCKNVLAWSGNE